MINCCGKPVGCEATHTECLFLRHPWKRANVFDDATAPCMASAVIDHEDGRDWLRCTLRHGHPGPHQARIVNGP